MSYQKIFIIFSLLTVVISCASYNGPESIDEKMSRYQARNKNQPTTPDMPIFHHKYISRAISSVSANESIVLEKYSNKRIYFLTLLHQYNQARSILNIESPKVGICPNFHTSMINNSIGLNSSVKDKAVVDYGYIPFASYSKKEYYTTHPEMHLPLSHSGQHPSIVDSVVSSKEVKPDINKLVTTAYKVHLEKNYQELRTLCQNGQSRNYYVFENLITYIKSHRNFSKSAFGMKSLLKTTIFSNIALMHAFKSMIPKGRSIASNSKEYSTFEEEIFSRLDATWTKDYFREMLRRRNALKKR